MKQILIAATIGITSMYATAQSKITSVLTQDNWSVGGTSYVQNGMTYQWAQNPNNVTRKVVGFSTAGANYDYDNAAQGQVKLRRKNNAAVTGDYSLVFAEGYSAGSLNSMSTPMPANMETYMEGNIYNRGGENMFDNTGNNKNNIERLDWITTNGVTAIDNNKVGFVVIQKGNEGDYNPVNIAAITAVDANGNPTAYGPLKRLNDNEWENIFNSSFSNRVNRAQAGNQLLGSGGGTHSRAGMFVTLNQLGVGNNVTIYGYSLFAEDLPTNAAPQAMIQVADNSSFPPTSCCYCGFDFVAVTGLFRESNSLPLAIHSFVGEKIDGNSNKVNFTTNNYFNELEKLELMKSSDGNTYTSCATFTPSLLSAYTFTDIKLNGLTTYYRIKLVKKNGGVVISNTLKVKNDRDVKNFEMVTNPVRTDLSFAYRCKEKTKLQATIIDLFGKIISTNALTAQPGTNLMTLNATNTIANGIYILQISKEGKLEQSIRFMKQ